LKHYVDEHPENSVCNLGTVPDAGLRSSLFRHDLGDWAERILATEQHSILLQPDAPGHQIARLGGRPRLAAGQVWPQSDDVPLAFVAELDLAAASSMLGDEVLPSAGLLQFFYDAEQEAWGFDPADRPKWRVLLTRGQAEERDYPVTLPVHARYDPVSLSGGREPTFPEWESWHVERLGMDRDALHRYSEALADWKNADHPMPGAIHRVLGHPDQIQGDMMVECQLAANGIYVGDASGYQRPGAEKLKSGAGDWRLLLQIDSEQRAKMMWGDVGRLYYWIRDQDLRNRSWDRVWLVLQCS
jgi:uncharacterized protein YwqG